MSHNIKAGDSVRLLIDTGLRKKGTILVARHVSDDYVYLSEGNGEGWYPGLFEVVDVKPDFKALADEYRHYRQKSLDIAKTLQAAGFKLYRAGNIVSVVSFDASNLTFRREVVTKEEL